MSANRTSGLTKAHSVTCTRKRQGNAASAQGFNGKWTEINLAGSTDADSNVNAETLRNGFSRGKMDRANDAPDSNEFGDDVGGFCQRNNFHDRN